MLRVALTGGIATGKSYVLEQFRKRGIPCLDADALARGATLPGSEAARAIAARFGADILTPDGEVDRSRLGAIVFADPAARRDLEAIVHPPVYRAIDAGLRAFELVGGYEMAIVAVPLLYETGHAADFNRVIVTACPEPLQVRRLLDRGGLSEEEVRQRLAAQWPGGEKARRADFVIRTDGTFDQTNLQVEKVYRSLRSR
jgi:dephospho-CoA kinase